MQFLSSSANPRTVAAGIALIRIVAGIVFFMHGQQKVFETGLGGVEGFFGSLGIPAPGVAALVVSLVELVGGLALIVGVFTRVAALLLAIDMITAFFVVHLANGFFVMNGGYELVLLLGATAVGLLMTGAGAFSVDAMLPTSERTQSATLTPRAR